MNLGLELAWLIACEEGPLLVGALLLLLVKRHSEREKYFYLVALLPALGAIAYARLVQKRHPPSQIGFVLIAAATVTSLVVGFLALAGLYLGLFEWRLDWYSVTHEPKLVICGAMAFFASMATMRLLIGARRGRV